MSLLGFVISIVMIPRKLTVPANTSSPIDFVTGIDSPVMAAWSIFVRPSMILPSAGTRSPGFTKMWSPMISSRNSYFF